jgi:HSP20 family protein
MSVNIMAGPAGPPPHEVMVHMSNPEQPVFTPSSENESSDDNGDNRECRRSGHRHGGPHPHRRGGHGPRGFGAGGPHGHHGPHGPRGLHGFERGSRFYHPFEHFGHRGGRGGMFGAREGPNGPHGHPHHGLHGRHHRGARGMHRPPFWPNGPLGFDFLQRFASEMGNGFEDLFANARDLNDNQIDFVPRADVFDTATEYVVHLSLPGAQKSDVSVDYDAQESTLRLAGVTHRPEFNEELHEAMITNERRREVGVFERSIKLSTRDGQPANVDQENVSAKLVDGVLIVRLAKGQTQAQGYNKKVVINEGADIDDAASLEERQEGNVTTNVKHASVVEIQNELDSMHVDSETEAGDLLQELDEKIHTPAHVPDEEDDDDAGDYVKVDVK